MQQREAVCPPDERTRVDIASAAYEDALRRTALVADARDYRPRPIRKTVYVTLNRPDPISNREWHALAQAASLALGPTCSVIARLETSSTIEHPAIMWVILVPADDVVAVQERLVRVTSRLYRGPVDLIWGESVPRNLRPAPAAD